MSNPNHGRNQAAPEFVPSSEKNQNYPKRTRSTPPASQNMLPHRNFNPPHKSNRPPAFYHPHQQRSPGFGPMQPPAAAFYPQVPYYGARAAPNQMQYIAAQQPAPARPVQKRVSKALPILDPNTKKVVIDPKAVEKQKLASPAITPAPAPLTQPPKQPIAAAPKATAKPAEKPTQPAKPAPAQPVKPTVEAKPVDKQPAAVKPVPEPAVEASKLSSKSVDKPAEKAPVKSAPKFNLLPSKNLKGNKRASAPAPAPAPVAPTPEVKPAPVAPVESKESKADDVSDDGSDGMDSYDDEEAYTDVPLKKPDSLFYTRDEMQKIRLEANPEAPDFLDALKATTGQMSKQNRPRTEARDNRHNRSGGRSRSGQRGRNNGGRYAQAPMPNIKVEPLKRTENAYRIGQVSDEDEKVKRRVNNILNKLTLDKFDTLYAQLLEIINKEIKQAHLLREIVALIFDKAVLEAFFARMYAKCCKQLGDDVKITFQDRVSDGEGGHKLVETNFRRILLNTCQEEFTRGSVEIDPTGKSDEDIEMARIKQKRRMLGNIRFIGELYKEHMISILIMHACITQLMQNLVNPPDEDIESLCNLMQTIGAVLDQNASHKEHMSSYFAGFKKLADNKALSSRIRFMCMDVIDLRRRGWKSRVKKAEAKTLAEVRQESNKTSNIGRSNKSSFGRPRMQVGNQDIRDTKKRVTRRGDRFDRVLASSKQTGAGGRSVTRSLKPAVPKPVKPVAAEAKAPVKPPKPDDEIKKKAANTFNEYKNARDLSEVVICIKELESPSKHGLVVSTLMKTAIEACNDAARDDAETILKELFAKKLITEEDFETGAEGLMDPEFDIDTPLAYTHLGDLVCRAIAFGAMGFDLLQSAAMDNLKEEFKAEKFLRDFLRALLNNKAAQAKFFDCHVDMAKYLNKGKAGITPFIERNNFQPLFPFLGFEEEIVKQMNAGLEAFRITEFINKSDHPCKAHPMFNRMVVRAVITSACERTTCKSADHAPSHTEVDAEAKYLSCYKQVIDEFKPDVFGLVQEAFLFSVRHGVPDGLLKRILGCFIDSGFVKSDDIHTQWWGVKPLPGRQMERKRQHKQQLVEF